MVEGRTEEDALALLGKLPETIRANIKAVAMDMWQAFENAARRMVPGAEIVHSVAPMGSIVQMSKRGSGGGGKATIASQSP